MRIKLKGYVVVGLSGIVVDDVRVPEELVLAQLEEFEGLILLDE
jgi:hypothetical protein